MTSSRPGPRLPRRAAPAFDAEAYQDRNTVERSNRLKGFRAVAMRTDKREFVFRGTVDVASIKIWLRDPEARSLRHALVARPRTDHCVAGRSSAQSWATASRSPSMFTTWSGTRPQHHR